MKVAIIGFGRFGQLIARLLVEYHGSMLEVVAASRRPHATEAEALGIRWEAFEHAARGEVVVLCVPIRALAETLDRLRPLVRPDALVVDTCSVKMYPAQLMAGRLPPEVKLLATHPMFGPDAVRDFGIAGRTLVSCPLRVSPDRLALFEGWFTAMGVEIVRLTPEEHDRQAAVSQGLVHFLGRAVERARLAEPAVSTANARRLFDLVRSVSADSPDLFRDLERYNPFASGVRTTFLAAANELEKELES